MRRRTSISSVEAGIACFRSTDIRQMTTRWPSILLVEHRTCRRSLSTNCPAVVGLRFVPDGQADLNQEFGPEDVFHYIYAVLHCPEYRRRYGDFLRSDFPRIPVPADHALFAQLAQLGARLTSLHLMTAHGDRLPAFAIEGSGEVEKVRYSEPSVDTPGRVWINAKQHFEGVDSQTWEFTIGGYQPAEKWLKDRKGRVLDFGDIQTYRRICAALVETRRIMQEIDDTIDAYGGWPIAPIEASDE